MRVLVISGSRDWSDWKTVKKALDELWTSWGPFCIFHGGCYPKGFSFTKKTPLVSADFIAERYARHHGIETIVFAADWEKLGRRAGPVRNELMLTSARARDPKCQLIAFRKGHSRGTTNCIEQAEKMMVKTLIYQS